MVRKLYNSWKERSKSFPAKDRKRNALGTRKWNISRTIRNKFTGEQDIGNGRAIIPCRWCRTQVSFPFGNESRIWQIANIRDFHTLLSTRYFDCHLFPHHLSNIHIHLNIFTYIHTHTHTYIHIFADRIEASFGWISRSLTWSVYIRHFIAYIRFYVRKKIAFRKKRWILLVIVYFAEFNGLTFVVNDIPNRIYMYICRNYKITWYIWAGLIILPFINLLLENKMLLCSVRFYIFIFVVNLLLYYIITFKYLKHFCGYYS